MKAMILAAGFGTRLLPVTKLIPKPCFMVVTEPIIIHIIRSLKAAHVTEIVINLHHLGDQLKRVVESNKVEGVTIHYSFEENILGTAGGIKKVQSLLEDDTFILHNGDIFSAIDLDDAVRFHNEKKAEDSKLRATMIVKDGAHDSFIGLDSYSKVTRFPYGALKADSDYTQKTYFTGIHILEPSVFDYIPKDAFYGINSSVYPAMFADGYSVYGYTAADGYWRDIGTPKDYLDANFYMLGSMEHEAPPLKNDGRYDVIEPSFIGKGTVIESGCTIGPYAVIGKGCIIGENSSIASSVIFDSTAIKGSSAIKDSIVVDDYTVSAA